MSIQSWPENERPRERLLQNGAQSLSDAELLAIFLRTGVPGKSAIDLAREMLQVFAGIDGVLNASLREFKDIKGLGLAKYCQLQAASELTRRSFNCRVSEQPRFTQATFVREYLQLNFKLGKNEKFACLFLDSQHRLICFEYLFRGSINSAQVYPRIVLQKCMQHNAAALICAHNHPSGDVRPSQADQVLTQDLTHILKMIDVKLLDHFILGFDKSFSMAENGMI